MMNQREDRAQEVGTKQGVPSSAPDGAGDGHDAAPRSATQPRIWPPLGAVLPAPGAGLPAPPVSGSDVSGRDSGHTFGPVRGGRLPPSAPAWPPGGGETNAPRARSAIEALNRDTMADITMRGEPMRSEHPTRARE
jgi:hypothetical protein